MPNFDRREVSYTQARNELIRTIQDEFISDLPETDRGDRVREIVYELADRYPDLDEQMTRRLMGEGLRGSAQWSDPV